MLDYETVGSNDDNLVADKEGCSPPAYFRHTAR